MNTLAAATVFAALSVSSAFPTAALGIPAEKNLYLNSGAAVGTSSVDFIPQQENMFGRPLRLDRLDVEAAHSAAESYFDFDTIITLGTLAMAGGALAAVGFAAARRRSDERASERHEGSANWRETVLQALEADLAHYTSAFRRAA